MKIYWDLFCLFFSLISLMKTCLLHISELNPHIMHSHVNTPFLTLPYYFFWLLFHVLLFHLYSSLPLSFTLRSTLLLRSLLPFHPRHSGPASPRWAGGQTSGEPSHVQPCGDSRASSAQVPPSHRLKDPTASLLEGESAGRWRGRHHQPPPALQRHW